MRDLKNISDIENYIKELENKNFRLQNTHAFRVGIAIMNFYNKPNNFNKFLGLNNFIKEIVSGTKKVDIPRNLYPQSKLSIKLPVVVKNSTPVINLNNRGDDKILSQYFYSPKFKKRKMVLSLNKEGVFGETEYVKITPNNFNQYILFSNADAIEVDLSDITNLSSWRGIGSYDDIHRTNKFLNLINEKNGMYKTLVHNGNLSLFPIFLDCINVFDNVVVEEIDEN